MKKVVRLKEIKISNFKNVLEGRISLENKRNQFKSNVLGVYGQNGSGKTTLLDALELLKYIIMGQAVPSYFTDYINVDKTDSKFVFNFNVITEKMETDLIYEFYMRKVEDNQQTNTNIDQNNNENKKYKIEIFNEKLVCPIIGIGEKKRMGILISTETEEVFVPNVKYKLLVGNKNDTKLNLLVHKKMASMTSKSFIFSKELLMEIRNNNNKSVEYSYYTNIIESIVNYGNFELFIINTANNGLISLNALPLTFKYKKPGEKGAIGNIALPLDGAKAMPKTVIELVEKILVSMNVVLKKIIPDLTIGIEKLGTTLLENGEMGEVVQFISERNKKPIALKYESEGIKKIISILQLLIMVFNQESITVAIDELDSGIFEYLLGEIIKIISEKGKGQLLFTSHNLRPLETLDRGCIVFTTTNPYNRYIRLENIKDSHNLRDMFYRNIVLGGQKEELYQYTNNAEITLAFKKSGMLYEK